MSRREDSKREKLRLEEDAMNKLLRDAGLYEEGMGLEEKRSMMQLLEESRASAQQEEAEREQWRKQEEKILKDTLNKSFNDNPEENAVGSSIQHDSEDSSRDSDIVAIPSGKEKVESKKSGDSDDSVTPDLSPVRASSPELLPPTRLFSRGPNTVTQASTSSKAGRKTLKENARGSSQNSEEDLFCDSQSSGEPKNKQKYQECVVSDSESRGQDDSRSPLRTPGRVRTVQQTLTVVKTLEKRTVTVECSTSKPSGSQQSLKRRYSVEEVTSESDGCESRVSSYSQPLFNSSPEKVKKLSPLSEDEDGIQLLSPVIGKRNASSSVGGTNNAKMNSKSLQDAEISNSVEPKEQVDAVMVDDSDDEDLILPTPSVSQSAKSNLDEKRTSTPDGCETTKSQEACSSKQPVQNKKVSEDEDEENNDKKDNEIDCSVDSQSPRLKQKKSASEVGSQNLDMISDSDEDQSFNYQNDRKRNVNVFFPQEGLDIPLKRRRKMTSEDRNGTFFRTSKETLNDCFKRILSLMSEDMTQLEHNQLRLSYRLKWMPPVVVDKRVKDSLDRPGAHNRKKVGEGISEKCLPRRAVRHTSRSIEALDEDSHHSEDSLPDIFSHEEQNAVPQNRRILKRRSLHQGLSHKRAKQAALQEDKESGQNLENSKLACESDEEFESNSLFPRGNKQEGILKVSKPNNTFHEVSSSKSLGMRNHASDSEGENVCIVAQTSDEECTMMEKPVSSVGDSQGREQASPLQPTPKITPQVRSQKRPLRNTFMLNPPSEKSEDRDCDSATSSTLPTEAQSDSRAQVSLPDEPLTSGIQRAEVKMGRGRGRGRGTPLSKRMKPLNFVSSSGNDMETRSILDRHEQAGPSSNEDICILDGNDPAVPSTSRSTQSLSNQVNRTGLSKRDPGGRLQIRPAPLKLKKNNAREKGGEGISSRQEEKEENTEITSSVAERRQVPNGQSTEDSREEEEAANLVPCPLCGKLYPLKQIEVHASDCLEISDMPEEQPVPSSSRQSKRKVNKPMQKADDQEELEIEEVGEMHTDRCVVVTGRARTPPKMVRCSYCKEFIKEGDDYLIHVQSCVVKQQIEKSIMSPSSENTPVSKSGFKRVGVQQKLGFRNMKSGSLFDQLEGSPKGQNVNRGHLRNFQPQVDSSVSSSSIESEEEYEIPSSPIRDFVPISAQKDSLIDYHNQFNKKTQRPIIAGAVGAGANKRGRKRRRKSTKSSKNASKKKRS